jgi:glycosyltransferase involved in cell wall biosynthesis
MKQQKDLGKPMISIIICLHKICDRFYQDLQKFKLLQYSNYEIILVLNYGVSLDRKIPGVRIVIPKTKNISLGEKRDIGWKEARGKYCAYIDDDAYPRKDWLINAYKLFQSDGKIGAVGGPNLTPPDDSYWSKIGGYIFESYVASGGQQGRFLPLKRSANLELQGVNMIISKHILVKLNGFKSKLFSGDDSKICSDIRKLGYSVVSDPDIIVYHHRRIFPSQHLKQISTMGRHRGFFVKAHKETLSLIYFVPLILTVGLGLGLICMIIFPILRIPFLLILLFFYFLGFLSSLRAGFFNAFIVSIGIILTHIFYGISFFNGMLLKQLYPSRQ